MEKEINKIIEEIKLMDKPQLLKRVTELESSEQNNELSFLDKIELNMLCTKFLYFKINA